MEFMKYRNDIEISVKFIFKNDLSFFTYHQNRRIKFDKIKINDT